MQSDRPALSRTPLDMNRAHTAGDVLCPICSHPSTQAASHIARFNGVRYTLHSCRGCGLGFWTPLKIIPEFYEQEGFDAYHEYHGATRSLPPWCEPFFVRSPVRSGRLLDVGCGDGSFIDAAHRAGFDCHGIDLDAQSISVAQRRNPAVKAEVMWLGPFAERCHRKAQRFDVLTFFEVLEHQDSPAKFLADSLALLEPGGVLAGSVPNAGRFLARLDHCISDGDLPPHHFLWFYQRALERALAGAGLVSITVVPSGNIGYRELRVKFRNFLLRLFGSQRDSLIGAATWCISWPAAIALWAGYALWPAHLYFQGQKPHGGV